MASKKKAPKADKGLIFEPKPRRKRPGRHTKSTRPAKQTFFTKGRCR